MGTSGTESFEGCLQTQFKYLPPQLALKLNLVRLQSFQISKACFTFKNEVWQALRVSRSKNLSNCSPRP